MIRFFTVTLLTVFTVSVAQAQVHNCNGTWTNQPCAGAIPLDPHNSRVSKVGGGQTAEADNTITTPTEAAPQLNEPLAPRLELIRKLRKVSDDYRSKQGVSLSKVELDNFRKFCEDRAHPYADCLKQFNEQNTRLINQNQNKQELDLQAERNRIEADKVDVLRGRGVRSK